MAVSTKPRFGRTFRAWFHGLAAHDDLPPKLDDLHQPEQSHSKPGSSDGNADQPEGQKT